VKFWEDDVDYEKRVLDRGCDSIDAVITRHQGGAAKNQNKGLEDRALNRPAHHEALDKEKAKEPPTKKRKAKSTKSEPRRHGEGWKLRRKDSKPV